MRALRRALALVLALCCLGALTAHADEGDAPAAESDCAHPGWQTAYASRAARPARTRSMIIIPAFALPAA